MYKIDTATGEAIDRFPMPWHYFRDELNIRIESKDEIVRKMLNDANYPSYEEVDLNDIKAPFVSRMSNHKVTGPAHKETIRAIGEDEDGKAVFISKTDLKKLKLNKDGEIEGYYNPDSDRLLYEALKNRLKEFDNNGEKAFAEPFYKPRSDGSQGPLVKKVKICETTSLFVDVQGKTAVASNDTMVRCDVFYVENDGYYFVPIYVADTVKKSLPNLACVRDKKSWKKMDDKDFVFSLYKNDLIKYYSKKTISLSNQRKDSTLPDKREINGEDGAFLYYNGLDISVAVLNAKSPDNVYEIRSIGKTSLKLEKYEVDVLGNYRKIEKEERKQFNVKK
jgi:CRISPR-associated endonuclease Csn1